MTDSAVLVDAETAAGDQAPTRTPKAEAKGLNFFYGTFHALKDLSMPVYEKKVTALIGPSGCGGPAPSSLSLLGHNE